MARDRFRQYRITRYKGPPMRLPRVPLMLLCALVACKRGSPDETSEAGPAGSSSAPAHATSPGAKPAEPVSGEYARYFVDMHRFSAVFPVPPESKFLPNASTATEVEAPDRSAFAVVCSAPARDGHEFDRAKTQTVGSGTFLSDSRPSFYGTESYEVHARMTDGVVRVMLFVKYSDRFCTAGVELAPGVDEQEAARFIDSFRPEPPPPPAR
jgi:hypothetical protein